MNVTFRMCIFLSAMLFFLTNTSFPHCEIPCGIYGDETRLTLLAEHITTIEKSINTITALSAEKNSDQNQLVRWITNKEHHAEEFQHIVYQYFMTQRIKPVDKKDTKNYK